MDKFKKLMKKSDIAVKTRKIKIGGKSCQIHIAEGPNTKSLAVLANEANELFLTSTNADNILMLPTTRDEILALAANVAAGNFNTVLSK